MALPKAEVLPVAKGVQKSAQVVRNCTVIFLQKALYESV